MNASRLGLTSLPLLDQSTYLLLVERRNITGLFMGRLLFLLGCASFGFAQRVGFLGQDVEAGAVSGGDMLLRG